MMPPANSASGKPQHFIQLDGLRAFAAFAVLVQHSISIPGFSIGAAGVRLFFVLSGFLITGILLRERDSRKATGPILQRFYVRRMLRIFPLFYLAILLAVVFQLPRIQEALPWHLTYTTNFLVAQAASDEHGYPLGHFWSLAVEEQFYMFWPAVILFTPARWLPSVFAAVILSAPLTRLMLLRGGYDGWPIHAVTTSCFDGLGMGALLALAFHLNLAQHSWWLNSKAAGGLAVVPIVALMTMYYALDVGYTVYIVLEYLAQSLLFMWLVGRAANGFTGTAGAILSNPLATYLGQISYGLYVYQGLVPAVLLVYGITFPPEGTVMALLVLVAVTVSTSMLSWHVFEKPINGLKRNFTT